MAAIGGVAGGEHRIDDDDQALGDVLGRLEIIFDRLERDRIAIEADMGEARRGDEVEHALGHVPGRRAGSARRPASCRRSPAHSVAAIGVSTRTSLGRQVAGDLVAEQGRDLADQRAEQLGRAVAVAHDGELVLHQRVANDRQSVHARSLRIPFRR